MDKEEEEEEERIQSANEIFEKVIENIQTNIISALFQYNFIPVDENNEIKELNDEEHDMEVIRLYRSLFTKACNQKLFEMIDDQIKTKFKVIKNE